MAPSCIPQSVFSEIRVRTWIQVVSRQKNRPLIGRPYRSANQRPIFLAGNNLNSCPDWSQEKLILGIRYLGALHIHTTTCKESFFSHFYLKGCVDKAHTHVKSNMFWQNNWVICQWCTIWCFFLVYFIVPEEKKYLVRKPLDIFIT